MLPFCAIPTPPMKLSPTQAILQPHIRTIDVHHHFFPMDLNKQKSNTDLGWKTPPENLPWTPEKSLQAMDAMNIDFAILSLPAISSGSISEENRLMARRRNEFAADICSTYPNRFGFFATPPFLDDVKGSLLEIAYSLDHLHANGIAIASSYGEGSAATYIGDERYNPIWIELNKRKAVLFLHGSQVPSSTPYPHPFLGVPITEVPNETFKAAAHLVVTGHRRNFPDIKIILAHLGGSTPFLASRIAVLSHFMGCSLSPAEIMEDFQTKFYYETALSACEANLAAMQKSVRADHIFFGTDFPAVNKEVVNWYTKNLQVYYSGDTKKLQGVMSSNVVKMFLRDEKGRNSHT